MSSFLADDGTCIPVHVSGTGSPMVLLHGWTANHLEWSLFLRGLQPHHRLYRWEARAHNSQPAKNPATLARMAQDLHNLLTHYDLQEVTLVGHSMGALTLWQYLQDYGNARLARLCIIDQSPMLMTDDHWKFGIYGDFDQQKSANFIKALDNDFAESVLQLIALGLNEKARVAYEENADSLNHVRVLLRKLDANPLIDCWKSLIAADFRALLPQITLPALLVYGGKSNFYPPDTGNHVASIIKDSQLFVYEEEDHSPHLWQRDRFLRDLLNFTGV